MFKFIPPMLRNSSDMNKQKLIDNNILVFVHMTL